MMESGEIIYEKVDASLRPPPKMSFVDNWMKELGSEVAGHGESSQRTQPKTKNPIVRTGKPVLSEQQEIENVSYLVAKASMKEQGDLLTSCVPASVKRSDQDKDADENVDADQMRTGRTVESEQSIGLFTQREEIDIDFRVVWIATCSCDTSRKLPCSRTREEDRESSSSRSTSSRFATKKRLQPIQCRFESDDS